MFDAMLTLGESCFLVFLIAEIDLLLVTTEDCLHVSGVFRLLRDLRQPA